MRRPLALSLAAAALLAGCDAGGLGLGVGTRCAAEKQEVRQRHGQPDRVEQATRSEIWIYNPPENITFVFSWDQDGEGCVVQRGSFARVPAPP